MSEKNYFDNPPLHFRIYCNTCSRETNHEAKYSEEFHYPDFDGNECIGEDILITRLILCKGCNTPTIENCWTMNNHVTQSGRQIYSVNYIPARMASSISARQFSKLSEDLKIIYEESISAFNANLNILCTIGIRALVEGICADKGFTRGSLEKKIEDLSSVVPDNITKCLHSFRFMGNNAAHELKSPSRSDLRLAIGVSEDILNFLYELDYKATRLASPPRRLNNLNTEDN
ncbi:MAG: DUF4145 domain-containing protein [Capsulimonas sp.]|uniref:DUF4145 domain-containing protein n=1 Tax=Capsulimonas sp. TaxID=2494211 RepID=UPI0032636801